jgi:hypothetical protein
MGWTGAAPFSCMGTSLAGSKDWTCHWYIDLTHLRREPPWPFDDWLAHRHKRDATVHTHACVHTHTRTRGHALGCTHTCAHGVGMTRI